MNEYIDPNDIKDAIDEAHKSINLLSKSSIIEIKSFANPPLLVKLTMQALITLLGYKNQQWKDIVSKSTILQEIAAFDCTEVDHKTINFVKKKYIQNPNIEWSLDKAKSVSVSCANVLQWVTAQVKLADILYHCQQVLHKKKSPPKQPIKYQIDYQFSQPIQGNTRLISDSRLSSDQYFRNERAIPHPVTYQIFRSQAVTKNCDDSINNNAGKVSYSPIKTSPTNTKDEINVIPVDVAHGSPLPVEVFKGPKHLKIDPSIAPVTTFDAQLAESKKIIENESQKFKKAMFFAMQSENDTSMSNTKNHSATNTQDGLVGFEVISKKETTAFHLKSNLLKNQNMELLNKLRKMNAKLLYEVERL